MSRAIEKMRGVLLSVLLLLGGAVNLVAADGVTINVKDGNYTVATEVYTAKVDKDAVLTSLLIGGVEFLAPATETLGRDGKKAVVPGLFACPTNGWDSLYKPPTVQLQKGNLIQAEGNGWKLTYTFHADALELTYEGAPEGGRGFKAGYPSADLALSLSHELHRACDPENQGELGWPVKRRHEPGNFAVLAKNGAGLVAEGVSSINSVEDKRRILTAPHRLDLLVFNSRAQSPGPLRHRIRMFRTPELAHAVTMQIQGPNRGHVFTGVREVEFPVQVNVLYGQTLKGSVAFKGIPYVWKKPDLAGETPISISGDSATVPVKIRAPKPGHYTGVMSITDGQKPVYSQRVGFMFQPEKIAPVVPPPDFDAFWDNTMAELNKVPLDLTLEERKDLETPAGRVFKAKYRSWEGRWAWAWLYVPKADKKVAATVWLPPVSIYQPPPPQPADGVLRIMVAVHGGDLKDYPAKPDFDYMRTGITSRENYMLRYSYCCLTPRCFDIIKAHEKCNGDIHLEGGSQGAGLSLVLAGLRNAKSARGMAIALCRIDWTVLGYAEWGPRAPAGADPKQVAEVVRYFDPACFAHRIRTPMKLAMGLFDFCAPAEGIFTAINAMPKETRCEVFIDPYGGHFTIDLSDFHQGKGILEVPRWQGTAKDNQLGP